MEINFFEIQQKHKRSRNARWKAFNVSGFEATPEGGVRIHGVMTLPIANAYLKGFQSEDTNYTYRIVPVKMTVERGEPIVD